MPETTVIAGNEIICSCNNVTRGAIVKAVQEKGYKRREDLTFFTRAGASCGSCAQAVADVMAAHQPAAAMPAPKREPRAYPKGLDVTRIKKEGLELDLARLRQSGVSGLSDDDFYRLKTYGVCGQKHPEYFMMRIRIPGGRVNAAQLEALAELAKYYGRSWGHLTTRQDLELHWVQLERVHEIWEQLESVGLTSRSACGHTLRNVMACPHAAIAPSSAIDVQPWAKAISDYFVSRSDALNPALPNRLNLFFAGCDECAAQAPLNDLGLVAIHTTQPDGRPALAFELWVGGSLGTFPLLGFKLRRQLQPDEVLPACQAIFQIHIQYSGRQKGKTRLKFLVEELGRERFERLFEETFAVKKSLPENRLFPLPVQQERSGARRAVASLAERLTALRQKGLPAGWREQRQAGYGWCELEVPLGEVHWKQLAALAQIARQHKGMQVCFNAEQNVELHWVREGLIPQVRRTLAAAEMNLREARGGARVVSCVGTQFCVLAVTNSQGAARSLLAQFTPRDERMAGLYRTLSIHISGCPNSCAKQQIADIGLAGGMSPLGDHRRFAYQLSVGGGTAGQVQLGVVIRKGLTEGMIVPAVEALLELALDDLQPGETFRGWARRTGPTQIAQRLERKLAPLLPKKVERVRMSPKLPSSEPAAETLEVAV